MQRDELTSSATDRASPQRASTDDMMSLAAERGSTPMQVGAVLTVDAGAGLDPEFVVRAFAHRITAVPRLRQRLVTVPWGCGRPLWVDDRDFAIGNHLSVLPCPPPGGERAVLGIAADMLGAPLLSFLGCSLTDIVALSSVTGNVTVAFAVLSYAGCLTITLVADPDAYPDVSALRELVEDELRAIDTSG